MERPAPAPDPGSPASPRRRDPPGHPELAPDYAAQADERFDAVCGELGILPARRVEPVAARVLPFGSEQVAMVERLDPHAAAASYLVAGVAEHAMTGGRNVLASALPSAVAEGKVRTAVVFGDGDAPVRWGLVDDEARLAALYAVVPHLGSFTATTGSDTYRVLRLPGIGVALVSAGQSASTWVEGWFAALLHAAQYSVRTTPTDLVAQPSTAGETPEDAAARSARVLEQLEDECRRILTAAQDQAREIREAAESGAARAAHEDREDRATRGSPTRDVPRGRHDDDDVDGDEHLDNRRLLSQVRREIDALLGDAERARATLLTDAQREADTLRRAAEQSCVTLVTDTRTQCESLLKAARREAKSMRRDAKRLRRDAARSRKARSVRAEAPPRSDVRAADVLGEARRTADDLLHDARRAADDMLRDAAHLRQRLLDDVANRAADVGLGGGAPETRRAPAGTATSEEGRLAALALLSAASESVAAISTLLGRVHAQRCEAAPGDPYKDLPGLYFGA